MNKQKIRNYCGQIVDLTEKIKKQPPSQRHAHADSIAERARNIRNELDKETKP